MSIKGIDVSSYQHPNGATIDWRSVRAAGETFVFVKATEGVGYQNPYFHKDVADARAAGLLVGAYHFFRANVDGVTQANHFLNYVGATKLDFPLAIDYETNDGTDRDLCHHRLDQVRTVLRQHGHRTMTYTYPEFWAHFGKADCKFCGSDPLWYSSTGISAQPKAPAPWTHEAVWQYSADSVHVPGIQGAIDLDADAESSAEWLTLTGRAPAHKPSGPPAWYHRLLEFPPGKLRGPGQTHVVNNVRYQYGPDVTTVQRKLAIQPNGNYGLVTEAHVKGFQHAHGLNPDGVVGPVTATRLGP